MKKTLNYSLAFGLIVISFTVKSQCSVTITSSDPTCFGDCDGTIIASPSGGVAPYTFQWFDGTGTQIGTNSNQLSNVCSGDYGVQVTDANGCTPALSSASLIEPASITFQSITTTDAGCVLEQCEGTVQASANGATKYSLNGVINNTGDFQSLCAGNYTLLAGNSAGCEVTESVAIVPGEGPYANFSALTSEMALPENDLITFNTSANATSYEWTIQGSNIDYAISEYELDLELPFADGNYEVCLIASNQTTCKDTLCQFVNVRDEFTIWVPNAFTPDGDEYNNTFDPIISNVDGQAYDFFIFDRWGQLVFESHDLNQGWDGTFNGEYTPAGIYVWKIRLKSIQNDEYREYTGQVTMLK